MILPWEGVVFWGAVSVSVALGAASQLQLWFARRDLALTRRICAAEILELRQRAEKDRNTIDSEVASYLNLSREELADLRGRLDKFKDTVEKDLDDMSADLDVIENSVASCVRASRASPFSSLNLQFLNDGLDDVRARLAALELAAQKAKLAAQAVKEDARPLWLVQREVRQPAAATSSPQAGAAPPQPMATAEDDVAEPRDTASRQPAKASFADWLSPAEIAVNDDAPQTDDAEPMNWPGSLGRLAAF